MRRPIPALVLALVVLAAPAAGAQRTFRTVGEDLRRGLSDMVWLWASPLRADGGDWLTAAGVVAVSAGVGAFDGEIQDWLAEHPRSAPVLAVQPFGESAGIPLVDLGSGKRLLPVAGLVYLAGFIADSRDLRDAGIGCVASQQVQTLTHEVAFHVVARQRPRVDGDAPYVMGADPYVFEYFESTPWGMHSFYGGHGASAMACATFLSERFDLGIAEPLLYVTAIGIAFSRVIDGRHWSSDTVLGLGFGHAIGRSVASRQRGRADRRARGETASAAPGSGPFLGGDGRALLVGWRRTF
jgi:membrane-associated phospholipid phosphatase